MSALQGNQFQILQALRNDYRAFAKQTLTVTTSVLGLTVPAGTKYCFIQVESTNTSDAIRYWLDGSSPTASLGFFRANGDAFDITEAENINNFKVIKGTGGGTTYLICQYYK